MSFLSLGFFLTLALFFLLLFLNAAWGRFLDYIIYEMQNQKNERNRMIRKLTVSIKEQQPKSEMINSDTI